MNLGNFFAELKRRNVYKVAIAYGVVAWLLIQVATQVFPFFEIPNWAVRLVVLVLLLGFPLALIFAWAFEITPQGIKRTEEVVPHESITRRTGRMLDFIIIGVLLVVIAFFIFERRHIKRSSQVETTEKSIAVLPFENLSSDKENAYFTDGVQDEILANLAKIADLKVISRISVMLYKSGNPRNLREIGQQLGVAHVLEGSVQRAASRIRVTAQLIDARTDAHLWAQTYDRDLADVFAIQSEIAKTIAEQLQAKLSAKEQAAMGATATNDMAAYDLYLQAREIDRNITSSVGKGGVEDVKREIKLFDEAVARDPAFVLALCRLANAHLYLYWNDDPTPAHIDLAKKALETAARLQPDAGEVHFTRAILHYWGARDYRAALAELAVARHELPNDAGVLKFTGLIERRQGNFDDAIRHLGQSLTLDPRDIPTVGELALTYLIVRRHDEAVRTADAGLALKPLDFGLEFFHAFMDMAWKADLQRWKTVTSGDAAKAADPKDLTTARFDLALLERDYHAAQEILATGSLAEFNNDGFFIPKEWNEAIVAHGIGHRSRANTAFLAARQRAAAAVRERPEDGKALIVLAQIDAALGAKENALREGQEAVELLPVAKDSLSGAQILSRLTGIYAQVGEGDRAFELLLTVAKIPYGVTYGSLKLDEVWDPLRGDPRFEEIVASLAPKEISPEGK